MGFEAAFGELEDRNYNRAFERKFEYRTSRMTHGVFTHPGLMPDSGENLHVSISMNVWNPLNLQIEKYSLYLAVKHLIYLEYFP